MSELIPTLLSVEEFTALSEEEQQAYLEARREDLKVLVRKAEGKLAVTAKQLVESLTAQNEFLGTLDQDLQEFREAKAKVAEDASRPALVRWHRQMELGIEMKKAMRTKVLMRIADMTSDLNALETKFAEGIQVDEPGDTVAYRKADAVADLACLRFHLMDLAPAHKLLAEVLGVPFQPGADEVAWRVTQAALPKAPAAAAADPRSGGPGTGDQASLRQAPAAGLSSLSLEDSATSMGLGGLGSLPSLGDLDGLPPIPSALDDRVVATQAEDQAAEALEVISHGEEHSSESQAETDGMEEPAETAGEGDDEGESADTSVAGTIAFDDLDWEPELTDAACQQEREALERALAGGTDGRIRAQALADMLCEARADALVARTLLAELTAGSVAQAARILSMPLWSQLDGRVHAVMGAAKMVAEVPALARVFPADADIRPAALLPGYEPVSAG
ncbi:MAG: hypothetical protein VKO21_08605 [Candidatus Sericytochromatia bacterium]|nr:hypothetical protein [Candidatus Sericytochromatia bacterium]